MKFAGAVFVAVALGIFAVAEVGAQEKSTSETADSWKTSGRSFSETLEPESDEPCVDGMAGQFTCNNVDLLAFVPLDSIGGRRGSDGKPITPLNDIWGWTDPENGREYALVGRADGTSFVDVTDPRAPVFVADLPKTEGSRSSGWRDVKVYQDHAFIVADNAGVHGMQVFDLTQLRDVEDRPATFEPTALYEGINSAHNVVINTESGYAYTVGNSGGGETCGGGLHMINIQDPTSPTFAGCHAAVGTGYGGTGYTHDAQCVIYHGPDSRYTDREICFGANELQVMIADVTDKDNPATITAVSYPAVAYAHQGWLTEDHRYFLQDDELDESREATVVNTRTLIWDMTELDDPQLAGVYTASTESIDHNQYVVGNRAFQSNYTSGLRILDISDPANPSEVGFFDTYPAHDDLGFIGTWSNYPFFESGNVVLTGIDEGLFVVRPTGGADLSDGIDEAPDGFVLLPAYPNPFNPQTTIELLVDQPQRIRVAVFDVQGAEVTELFSGFVANPGRLEFVFDATDVASGVYYVRAFGASGSETRTVTLQK